MGTDDNLLIRVHDQWNGWHTAEVRFRDLRDVHWFQPRGASHPMIHAFVFCSDFVGGDIQHQCDSSRLPHLLHVCVLKKHVVNSAYATLVRRADERDAAVAMFVSTHAGPVAESFSESLVQPTQRRP